MTRTRTPTGTRTRLGAQLWLIFRRDCALLLGGSRGRGGAMLPLLFFLACLPFHLAWNRRAARLRSLPKSEVCDEKADAWPPAPKRS